MDYSVIVPVYQQTALLKPFLEGVLAGFKALNLEQQVEMIFVDDASTHLTKAALSEITDRHPHVSALCFRRRAGLSMALAAGFLASTGEHILLLLDGIEKVPDNLPQLIQKITEGHDAVVSRTPHLNAVLLKREVMRHIKLHGNRHKALPSLLRLHGFRVAEMGDKPLFPSFNEIHSLIERFSMNPLTLFGRLSLGFLITSLCFMSITLFALSINAFLIGLACEFILHHSFTKLHDQMVRSEIVEIIGTEYAKKKITYGLASVKMQQVG